MLFRNLYLVNLEDNTISDDAQDINVDIHVQMTIFSVRETAGWGQTIGTTGMSDCIGLFLYNEHGAFLAHNLAQDTDWSIPAKFHGPNTYSRNLDGGNYEGGSSDYAFKLDPDRGVPLMYRSKVTPPFKNLVTPKTYRANTEYSTIDWAGYGVPHTPDNSES